MSTLLRQETLSVKAVARQLGVSKSYIYKLIHQGRLPYIKIGTVYRIPRRDLMAILELHTSDDHSGI